MLEEPRGLWELLERRVEVSPDREFLVDEAGRRLTFAEFKVAAERAAAGFAALGVGEATVVSWQLPTRMESVVLVAALARLGAVQNPMLPIYREREVGFVTRQCGARWLVVPGPWRGFDYPAMAASVAAQVDGLEVLVVDRELPVGDPAGLGPAPVPPATPQEAPVRWVFYTSGTTAAPKGARHTDATIAVGACTARVAAALGPHDRTLLVFPFTHVGGIIHCTNALVTGGVLVLVEHFEAAAVADLAARERVTVATGGPPIRAMYLAEHRRRPQEKLFGTIRAYPGGGAPKPPGSVSAVREELGGSVVAMYGLTEAPNVVAASLDDPPDKLAETEGRPTRGVEIRIVTLDDTIAGPGEIGEIRVKAPQLCRGYVDATLNHDAFDPDGYFRTGDLGYQDPDGYLTITGRLKDIIIRNGENISAKEVEDLLYTHPKVTDVAVIGLPDPTTGERACAVVTCLDPHDPLTFTEMTTYLKDHGLMTQKIPEQLELVDTVPRNPAGKILKHDLRAQYDNTAHHNTARTTR